MAKTYAEMVKEDKEKGKAKVLARRNKDKDKDKKASPTAYNKIKGI